MNAIDLLGAVMNSGGMSRSAKQRVENSFGLPGGPGQGGAQGMPSGANSGSMMDILKKVAGSMGTSAGTGGGGLLGSLAGAVLGGGGAQSQAAPRSMGSGLMAMLGALTAQALQNAGAGGAAGATGSGGTGSLDDLIAGFRKPESREEEETLENMALLTVKAMVNAAKADGRIDEQEMQNIAGKVKENGVTPEEQAFLLEEMRKPMETEAIVSAAGNPQIAAQIYSASLLAIEIDTDAERRYMDELARSLRLDPNVAQYLRASVGIQA